MPVFQAVSTRYLDEEKLIKLLESLFDDNFEVELKDDVWMLRVPRKLTEVRQCQYKGVSSSSGTALSTVCHLITLPGGLQHDVTIQRYMNIVQGITWLFCKMTDIFVTWVVVFLVEL